MEEKELEWDSGKREGVFTHLSFIYRDSNLDSINEEFIEINAEYMRAQRELEDTTVEICGE